MGHFALLNLDPLTWLNPDPIRIRNTACRAWKTLKLSDYVSEYVSADGSLRVAADRLGGSLQLGMFESVPLEL